MCMHVALVCVYMYIFFKSFLDVLGLKPALIPVRGKKTAAYLIFWLFLSQ